MGPDQMQADLLQMVGKPVKEFAALDMGAEMAKLGLEKFFPDLVWFLRSSVLIIHY